MVEQAPSTDIDLTRLTEEILALKRTAERDNAETIAEIGRCLAEAQEGTKYGKWLAWVRSELPFSEASARNYIALRRWAEFQRSGRAFPAGLRGMEFQANPPAAGEA